MQFKPVLGCQYMKNATPNNYSAPIDVTLVHGDYLNSTLVTVVQDGVVITLTEDQVNGLSNRLAEVAAYLEKR